MFGEMKLSAIYNSNLIEFNYFKPLYPMQNDKAKVKKALKLLDPVFVFFCDTEHNMDHDPYLKQYFLDAKDCLKEAIDLLTPNPKDHAE